MASADDSDRSQAMDTSDDSSSDDDDDSSIDARPEPTRKRKLSAVAETQDSQNDVSISKRIKNSDARAQFSRPNLSMTVLGAIWQNVFMCLPPATLLRLTRVNRRFRFLLLKTKSIDMPIRRATQAVQVVDSESIWTQSRRKTYPSLPKPLPGLTESHMLRLVTTQRCDQCLERHPLAKPTTSLNGGPGLHGVRPIWQFKLALCGPCLKALTMTDVEVFQMKSELRATDLRKGVTFVFLTKDLHIVSEQTARQNPGQGIVKVYLRHDVEEVLNDFNDASTFGGGAREEWVKGLDLVGKEATTHANRWQRWEDQLPSGTSLPEHMRKLDTITWDLHAATSATVDAVGVLSQTGSSERTLPFNPVHPLPKPVHSVTFEKLQHEPAVSDAVVANITLAHHNRPSRPPGEVHKVIQTRRAEIERRARLLVPTIEPDVLALMPAFKAAILIGVPLTEADWNRLQPRLEAEREQAEQVRYHQVQTMAAFHAANPSNWHYPDSILQQSRTDDDAWDASQVELRNSLGRYADEVINSKYHGQEITKEVVPYFAADVLTSIFDRYTAAHEYEAQDRPFLSLDALKWTYENKIRPLTEYLVSQMFMCAGCLEEGQTRWFAFEGLVQHYGAKHTEDYSKGNITVHWQTAEWTEYPPFVTDTNRLLPQARRRAFERQKKPTRGTSRVYGEDMLLSANPLFNTQQPEQAETMGIQQEHGANMHLFAEVGQHTWSMLHGISGLEPSLRVRATINSMQMMYDTYSSDNAIMPLDFFIQCITTNENEDFAELQKVDLLTCAFCAPQWKQDLYTDVEWTSLRLQKKGYKLFSLLNHYQLSHQRLNLASPRPREWFSTIDGPDPSTITGLIRAPGMTDAKLAVLDSVFPDSFPHPLPVVGLIPEIDPSTSLARRVVEKQFGRVDPRGRKKKGRALRAEYDPTDAMLPRRAVAGPVDLSRFDTDLPAQLIAQPEPPMGTSSGQQFSLTPDTLSAIQSLSPGAVQYTMPPPLPPPPPPMSLPGERPADPSIAAILAALREQPKRVEPAPWTNDPWFGQSGVWPRQPAYEEPPAPSGGLVPLGPDGQVMWDPRSGQVYELDQ